MSKRDSGSICRGKPKVKKRKGVKIRTVIAPDSDEEDSHSNITKDYARLVQTRVTASGKVGNVTTSSIPLLEVEDTTTDVQLGEDTNRVEETVIEDTVPVVPVTKKKRKKANDSVSLTWPPSLSCLANDSSDQDAFLDRHPTHCA